MSASAPSGFIGQAQPEPECPVRSPAAQVEGLLGPTLPITSPLQFQGKWYVVGLAGNAFSKEELGKFTMYSTTYELKEDHSYNVTSILLR